MVRFGNFLCGTLGCEGLGVFPGGFRPPDPGDTLGPLLWKGRPPSPKPPPSWRPAPHILAVFQIDIDWNERTWYGTFETLRPLGSVPHPPARWGESARCSCPRNGEGAPVLALAGAGMWSQITPAQAVVAGARIAASSRISRFSKSFLPVYLSLQSPVFSEP